MIYIRIRGDPHIDIVSRWQASQELRVKLGWWRGIGKFWDAYERLVDSFTQEKPYLVIKSQFVIISRTKKYLDHNGQEKILRREEPLSTCLHVAIMQMDIFSTLLSDELFDSAFRD
jgi:hypothetical protein